MRTIMVMFDSLNLRYLSPYGCDWVKTPNFERLAAHSVTFDNFYAGSLPCMPARRELQTGRLNFLHRSWGPIEIYDDSMPEILKNSGIYTHLCTDHWHYWEEGGNDYQTRFNSFEYARGQEGDPWKGIAGHFAVPEHIGGRRDACGRQEYINREFMADEKNQSMVQNFAHGLEFIELNHDADNWFLQLENFDPHEPFFVPDRFMALYEDFYNGRQFDWPNYLHVGELGESEEEVRHCICKYAALVTMCDEYLGKVLDLMDKYNMWDDTMLIVNTDHGFLLTEHTWWGKVMMPYYNEIAHTPFFIWDPRSKVCGEHRSALAQTIDIPATILSFFGRELPKDMEGVDLGETVVSNKKIRDFALFGQHGVHVNVTDGKYVYMRGPATPENEPIYNYVLMPTSFPKAMTPDRFADATLTREFSFTKGAPLIKVHGGGNVPSLGFPPKSLLSVGNLLFNIEEDPGETTPVHDEKLEDYYCENMVRAMIADECPKEQYERLGLMEYYERVTGSV